MKITRVVFYKNRLCESALAVCSVVFDDGLRLNDIRLKRNEDGYFLVFPSRQDLYAEIRALNEGIEVKFPVNHFASKESKKRFEEFYHPLNSELYKSILEAVVAEYEKK